MMLIFLTQMSNACSGFSTNRQVWLKLSLQKKEIWLRDSASTKQSSLANRWQVLVILTHYSINLMLRSSLLNRDLRLLTSWILNSLKARLFLKIYFSNSQIILIGLWLLINLSLKIHWVRGLRLLIIKMFLFQEYPRKD